VAVAVAVPFGLTATQAKEHAAVALPVALTAPTPPLQDAPPLTCTSATTALQAATALCAPTLPSSASARIALPITAASTRPGMCNCETLIIDSSSVFG
jgi:hypothetical protein